MWRSNLARPSSKLSKKRPQPLWKWKPTTWTSDLLSPIPVHQSLLSAPETAQSALNLLLCWCHPTKENKLPERQRRQTNDVKQTTKSNKAFTWPNLPTAQTSNFCSCCLVCNGKRHKRAMMPLSAPTNGAAQRGRWKWSLMPCPLQFIR